MPDGGYAAWMAQEQLFGDSAAAGGGARASRERWVPQMMYGGPELAVAGSKRSRTAAAPAAYSYW